MKLLQHNLEALKRFGERVSLRAREMFPDCPTAKERAAALAKKGLVEQVGRFEPFITFKLTEKGRSLL